MNVLIAKKQKELEEGEKPKCWNCEAMFTSEHQCCDLTTELSEFATIILNCGDDCEERKSSSSSSSQLSRKVRSVYKFSKTGSVQGWGLVLGAWPHF